MGLVTNNSVNKKEEDQPQKELASFPISKEVPQLSKQEIEYLLLLIKETSFKGEDVELLYNLVLKLQRQYINL